MGTVDVGARLRSCREALGMTIDDLAERTRVQPRILDAIERNDLAAIPPKPYGRGFVRAYAREVRLDSEDAVREYFGQFPPAPPEPERTPEPEPWPRQTSWIIPASGLLVAALVLAAIAQGERSAPRPDSRPTPVGTAGSHDRTGAVPEHTPSMGRVDHRPVRDTRALGGAEVRATGDPTRPAAPGAVSIVLVADRVCWVTAAADGTRVLYELLQPGAQHTIEADREVTVRAGDAGALRVSVNGRSPEVFGRNGEVRTARITASGNRAPGVPPAH